MGDSFRVGFCVSGGGRLMRSAVLHARTAGIVPALVVLDDKADASVEEFCRQHGVPCERLGTQPRASFDERLFSLCNGAHLNLLSLTFDKIVAPPLIRHYAGRVINVHPALLPSFAGMNALDQAAQRGVRFAGATIHEADELVDHGAIIAQCLVGIRRGETNASMGARLFPLMRLMYLQVLAWFAAGRIEKDETGRVWVRDAVYGETPIAPSVELAFPD